MRPLAEARFALDLCLDQLSHVESEIRLASVREVDVDSAHWVSLQTELREIIVRIENVRAFMSRKPTVNQRRLPFAGEMP